MVEALPTAGAAPRSRPITFGYAVKAADLRFEERRTAIVRDCSTVTPEYECKWDVLHREDGALDSDAMDQIVSFATVRGLGLNGHTLCWHGSIPRQFVNAEPTQFRIAATTYLSNVVRKYQGRILSWHVVNEPLRISDGRGDGLRVSPYFRAFGPSYLHEMFQLVAGLDPRAVLVLNEVGLEYGSCSAEHKRQLMLNLLRQLLSEGVPVNSLGLQSHLNARDFLSSDHRDFTSWLGEVTNLGVSVRLTELDVDDRDVEGDADARDAAVAKVYRDYLEMVMSHCDVEEVTLWGISDEGSWLQTSRPGPAARPLALDEKLARKPAWYALQALKSRKLGGASC